MDLRIIKILFSKTRKFVIKLLREKDFRNLVLVVVSVVFFLDSFIVSDKFSASSMASVQYFTFCSILLLLLSLTALFSPISGDLTSHLFAGVAISSYCFVYYEALAVKGGINSELVLFVCIFLLIIFPIFDFFLYAIYAFVYFLIVSMITLLLDFDKYSEATAANTAKNFMAIFQYFVIFFTLGLASKSVVAWRIKKYKYNNSLLEEQLKENRKEHFKLYKRAYYDFLTGLYNRMMMEEQIRYSIKHAVDDEGSLGLLFVDLDNFKEINDRYGHKAGDECLMEAARRFNERFEKSKSISEQHNFVARIAGDEFIVVLVNVSERMIRKVCEDLLASCDKMLSLDTADEKVQLTFSIGAYWVPFDQKRHPEIFDMDWKSLRILLFTVADRNMYRAKRKKRSYYMTKYSKADYEAMEEIEVS